MGDATFHTVADAYIFNGHLGGAADIHATVRSTSAHIPDGDAAQRSTHIAIDEDTAKGIAGIEDRRLLPGPLYADVDIGAGEGVAIVQGSNHIGPGSHVHGVENGDGLGVLALHAGVGGACFRKGAIQGGTGPAGLSASISVAARGSHVPDVGKAARASR